RAQARAAAIERHLWHEDGYYGDLDLRDGRVRAQLTAAALFPLHAGIAAPERASRTATAVRAQLLKPGGLLTTAIDSGQQWDAPNVWAPLQWIAVDGLRRYGDDALAREIAAAFVGNVRTLFEREHKLVEKYDADGALQGGGGGEYPLQDGFGWSNGVALALMALYPGLGETPVSIHEGPARRTEDSPAQWAPHEPRPVRASVLLLLPEGPGGAVREPGPVRVPAPGGAGEHAGAAGTLADRPLPGAGRRRAQPARGQRHHRIPAPAPSRAGPAAARRSAAGAGRAPAGPLLRQLRVHAAAEAGVRRPAPGGRARSAWGGRGPAPVGDQLRLAGAAPGRRPPLGGRAGLQHGRLRCRPVPVLRGLEPPDPGRMHPRPCLPRAPARKALDAAGGGRGAALPPLLSPRRAGPRLAASGGCGIAGCCTAAGLRPEAMLAFTSTLRGASAMTQRRRQASIRTRSILAAALVAALPSALAEPLKLNEQEIGRASCR